MPVTLPGSIYQFGDFELDCLRFELRQKGRPLRVERKPMELLILLVSREGQLVARSEIAQRLWSSEVFVDTEHGINTAIRKLRYILHDDPENPRFIQTVTGLGYRFIAPMTAIEERTAPAVSGYAPNEAAYQAAENAPAAASSVLPRVPRLWFAIAGCAILVGALVFVAGRLVRRNAAPSITSLAVLPLDNLSGDPHQEYFADGMTDELTTMLAKDSNLRIVSRTSVMQFKGAHRPLVEIAHILHVDGIVEGSISRSSEKVHMTLQLIRADTDTHLWADSYDRTTADADALPDEAAKAIAARLKSSVSSVAPTPRINPEAHDAYLQGRYYWFGDNYAQCTEQMQKAIDLQPDYALAWSGLSDCYGGASAVGLIPPGDGFEKEHAAALRALELDSTLAEAHHSLAAYYLFHNWDWQRAEAESKHAIELNPNTAEFHHLYSYILRAQNRDQEAFQEQKRATELDPYSRPWALGSAYIYMRQFDAAVDELRAREDSYSQNYWLKMELARAYRLKGIQKEWVAQLEQAYVIIGDNASADAIEHAFSTGGEKAVAQWNLNRDLKKARTQYLSPYNLAYDYSMLGQKEETFRALEDAYRERSPWLVFLAKMPEFDFLHADPRYRSLVQRIGLPSADSASPQ